MPLPDELSNMPKYISTYGVVFQTDCKVLFSYIKDNSIDCIFADPPFNLNKDYGNGFKDYLGKMDYLDWSKEWIDESIRVLKPGGALFIYNIPRWLYHYCAYIDDKMDFKNWIAITMKNTFPRGNRLYPAHYGLIYFTKGKPRVFNKVRLPIPVCRHCGGEIKDYGGHRDKLNKKGLNLTDFWEDTSPVRHAKFKHRVANELKPMIPSRAIQISTNKGDIVFDPFGGGGSTFQEAQKFERFWIGSEIGIITAIEERMNANYPLFKSKEIPEEILIIFSKQS